MITIHSFSQQCSEQGMLLYSRSGRALWMRAAGVADRDLIVDLLLRMSTQSRQLRYFVPRPFSIDSARIEAQRILSRLNGCGQVYLVTGMAAGYEAAIGLGELVIDPGDPRRAEFAIIVRDSEQADGIGTALAQALLSEARQAGVTTLYADFLPGNTAARRLIRRLDLPCELTMGPEYQVALRLAA